MKAHNLEEMSKQIDFEPVDFETGERITWMSLVISKSDDDNNFVLIDAERYIKLISNSDFEGAGLDSNQVDNFYCLGLFYKQRLIKLILNSDFNNDFYCLRLFYQQKLEVFKYITDDVLKAQFPQVHEYFHKAKG